jgi:radical S-adenosyl methionine domain-containing protein 2
MVLLSLLPGLPALRFFVGIVLATFGYIVYKQSGFNKKHLTHETSVHQPRSEHAPQEALDPSKPPDAPISVNYFPSRECNYKCGFCFHTETSSYILTDEKARKGLKLLKEAGMRKPNIAGGEPFLHPKLLSSLIRYCKEDLGVESISIVSNGSKITEKWMQENSKWLDILAISCDSFNAQTNVKIGRGDDGKNVE